MLYAQIVFLPLLGSLIAGLLGRVIGRDLSERIPTILLFTSAVLSIYAFVDVALFGNAQTVRLATWIASGDLTIDWALKIDTLTAVMLVVVTGVSSLVHLYSIGYMAEDPHTPRFFSYLSLFTFMMLMLVTANNFLQMFFGWEGVGLASYLLIGFWYTRPSANAAAIKAFLVNRVGDFGFALGVFGIYAVFGTLDFGTVFANASMFVGKNFTFAGYQADILTTLCILLFIGAMGKSAQIGLHTWLPDAMEGPTPVSALIHAATMVTAGVFLVCRCSPLFELAPTARDMVAIVGATTAFFAATVGLFQNDIKRVIAYSTCSQLGYMFAAAGVSAYGAAMFHLFTHAFFKALLFLGAGSVIHAMHHEQDMRRMGGLYERLPQTWLMMLIGNMALTGVGIPLLGIGMAGFHSKDAIINAAYEAGTQSGTYAFTLTVIAAVMTSFYSWRQFLMTFHGPYRGERSEYFPDDDHAHAHHAHAVAATHAPAVAHSHAATDAHGHHAHDDAHAHDAHHADAHSHDEPDPSGDHHGGPLPLSEVHESPRVMLVPLVVLAVGAVLAGILFEHLFVESAPADFWRGAVAAIDGHALREGEGEVPLWVELAPFAALLTGLWIAYYYYVLHPELPPKMRPGILYQFLYNKWYFDELYDFLFVRPAKAIGRFLWRIGDGLIIDGFGPDGIAARVLDATRGAVKLQSGYVYHYAFAMLMGVAAFVTWFLFSHGSA